MHRQLVGVLPNVLSPIVSDMVIGDRKERFYLQGTHMRPWVTRSKHDRGYQKKRKKRCGYEYDSPSRVVWSLRSGSVAYPGGSGEREKRNKSENFIIYFAAARADIFFFGGDGDPSSPIRTEQKKRIGLPSGGGIPR